MSLIDLYPVLQYLPATLRERLLSDSQPMTVPAGTVLFDEHQPCQGFPFVLAGSVRVVKLAANGRELPLYKVLPGESCIITSSCLLGHADYNARGVTENETTLVLLPRARSQWQPLPLRGKRKLHFPAGVFEFIGADDPVVGEHQTCSLFSPMHDFQDQAAARLVARLAREALFDTANAEVPEFPQADLSPGAPAPPQPQRAAAAPPAAVTKRDFLRGRLSPGGHVDRG